MFSYSSPVAVLICDDEPAIRLLYRTAFEEAGAEVIEAEDGEQCVELAARERPELVVLDLYMPRRGGISALDELRTRCSDVPVVVVSARAVVDTLRTTQRLGAVQCFAKSAFQARIPEVLRRYGRTAEAG